MDEALVELLREADEAEAAAAALRPTISVEEEVATIARAEAIRSALEISKKASTAPVVLM